MMNFTRKRAIFLSLIFLYQLPCIAQPTSAVFLRRMAVVAPLSLVTGCGLAQLVYTISANKSNEEFKAHVEAKAESQRLHYSSQAGNPDAEATKKSFAALTTSSALAKEVSKAQDDAAVTAIKLREACRDRMVGGVVATLGFFLLGASASATID